MIRLGINAKTREAILDPQFSDFCETETLESWLNDTLRINYLARRDILGRVKQRSRG